MDEITLSPQEASLAAGIIQDYHGLITRAAVRWKHDPVTGPSVQSERDAVAALLLKLTTPPKPAVAAPVPMQGTKQPVKATVKQAKAAKGQKR
jgi:hypothetical protein